MSRPRPKDNPSSRPAVEDVDDYFLRPHRSRLPLLLYLFSFAPPLPTTLLEPWQLLRHPYFRYAFAVSLTMVSSLAIPALDILFGRWSEYISPEDAQRDVIRFYSNQSGYLVFVIGLIQMALTWASFSLFVLSVEQLTSGLRITLLASLLAQDHAYFDEHGPGELAGCVSSDIDSIRIGFGEKIYYVSFSMGVLIASGIVGFVKSPTIAGVLFSIIPITMGIFAILGYLSDKFSSPALQIEASAATFMEQILNSPRIVHAFNISQALLARLDSSFLLPLRRHSRIRAAMRAVELSSIFALLLWNYGAFFCWGAHQIAAGHTTIGPALTSFWSFMNCFFTIANVVPHFGAILQAVASLRNLRSIIEREPKIDVRDSSGVTLDLSSSMKAAPIGYSVEDVTFAYPSRPTVPSLSGVNLMIQPGQITALVGPSGSGKSTLLALLLREFDPEDGDIGSCSSSDVEKSALPTNAGRILFGGHDLRGINTAWYRSQIGTVSQDPQLFPGTVFSNIVAGITRHNLHQYRTTVSNNAVQLDILLREKVTQALVKAQAWDFVSKLPNGLDTTISGGGSSNLLSGGQRQRIAIARALVREPMILFLDEATSALDSATEEAIRLAIEREQRERGMTCCIVAHRLSTIRRADTIVVLEAGRIVDQGTHRELTSLDRKSSTYRDMAAHQQMFADTPGTQSVASSSVEENLLASPDDTKRSPSESDTVTERSSRHVTMQQEGENNQAEGGKALPALGAEDRQLTFRQQAALIWKRANGLRLMFLCGLLAAILASGILPATGFLTGQATAALALPDPSDLRRRSYFWAIMMFVVGVASLLLYIVQGLCLEGASGILSINLQHDSLEAIMVRDVTFFEMTADDGGGMAASLNTHPTNITSITGNVLGNAVIAAGNIIGSIAAGLALTWRSTLVTFAPITLLAGTGCITVSQLEHYENMCRDITDRCSTFVSQHIGAIRTITALGRQREVLNEFICKTQSQRPTRTFLLWGAFGFAFGQSFMIVSSALVFYYAGNLLADDGASLHAVFAIFELQIIAGFAAARLTAFIPDIARARASLKVVASWLLNGPASSERRDLTSEVIPTLNGKIQFRNVELRYPQRPEYAALRDIDLDIPEGHTVAFIGTSGSGKSSALSLLSRFYSPCHGSIFIDDKNMLEWNTIALRSRTALVSQHAVLFQGSIRWNVALGASVPDEVSDEQIREACRQANILDFVLSLPDGFDSQIGIKGSQLSGGQRQRLCIARALVRNPAILLLDEATSALDAESEIAVQKALETASKGRTTVLIAHRLSTVRNADRIYVFEDGRVVESGNHTELISRRSRYLELMHAQM